MNELSWLCIILIVIVFSTVYSYIDDTDETFGYWEPLHYLLFNKGMQTWYGSSAEFVLIDFSLVFYREYDPTYAIRSYAFITPFKLLLYMIKSLLSSTSEQIVKVVLFYLLKFIFGLFAAYSAVQLIKSVSLVYSKSISTLVTIFLLTSPGISFASVAFLPSAVSMTLIMLATSNFFFKNYIWTVFYGCVAVLFTGWPFVGVILLFYGLSMLIVSIRQYGSSSTIALISQGFIILLTCLVISTAIDAYFYKKM